MRSLTSTWRDGPFNLGLLTIVLMALSGRAAHAVTWQASIDEAQAAAAANNRLVLVHFWSESCGPCLRLEKTTFHRRDFAQALQSNYVPVKINVSERQDLARRYKIDRIPTDVIMTADGKELFRTISPSEPGKYISMLDQVASHARVAMRAPPTYAYNESDSVPVRSDDAVAVEPRHRGAAPNGAAPNAAASNAAAGAAQTPPSRPVDNPYALSAPPQRAEYHGAVAQQVTAERPVSRYSDNSGMAPGGGAPSGAAAAAAATVPPRANPPYSVTDAAARGEMRSPTGFGMPAGAAVPHSAPGARQPQLDFPQRSAVSAPPQQPFPALAAGPQRPQQGAHLTMSDEGPAAPAASRYAMGAAPASAQQPAPSAPASSYAPPRTASMSVVGQMPAGQMPAGQVPYGAPNGGQMPQPTMPPGSAPALAGAPPGLEGFCPVSLVEERAWRSGHPQWIASHEGRLYFFSSPQAQQAFQRDPRRYAPALAGFDVVRFKEQGAMVPGKREHGVSFRGRYYLFADEASLQRFWQSPQVFENAAAQR